jgi:hypothetical protein
MNKAKNFPNAEHSPNLVTLITTRKLLRSSNKKTLVSLPEKKPFNIIYCDTNLDSIILSIQETIQKMKLPVCST